MNKKQKLELTWIGKDEQPVLEPRILIEDPTKSYGDPHNENMLIHGDNLLALKALEQKFAGKIKCIYIDPPFNTQQAFEHYDDSTEHSDWLRLIRDRVVILHKLMTPEGTLFVHIDDNELGYLIVMLDEIFGRNNRQNIVTFKQGSATGHKAINPGCVNTSNYILIYSKSKPLWKPNKVYTGRGRDTRYGQYIVNKMDAIENWKIVPLTRAFSDSQRITEKAARKLVKESPELLEAFVLDNAAMVIRTARPDYDSVSAAAREMIDKSKGNPDVILKMERDGHSDMVFKNGERILFYSDKLKMVDGKYVAGEPLTTLWDDILSNNLHNEGGVTFPKGKKPEQLIKRVFDLVTSRGDWVLDSFSGSGTTGAVAHKMGLRWIMVEMGEHCHTHIIPRLQMVCDGTDQGGVSKAVEWKGGGGFKFYDLAPSLLKQDKHGNYVISEEYNADMMAAAMAKQEGFTYAPSQECYWKQGFSTEQDFIFTTTNHVTQAMIDLIAEEMAEGEHLLICCKKFSAGCDKRHLNIQVKKIPTMLMGRCEFGKEDYSSTIVNLTDEATAPVFVPQGPKDEPSGKGTARTHGNKNPNQLELF